MTTISRLYLDTNVFIAMAEGTDTVAQHLYELTEIQRVGERFLFTSELSLAELLVFPYRSGDQRLIGLYDDWIAPDSWLNVGTVDRSVLREAARIRGRHPAVKLPDAIHLATAVISRCSHFLTGDKRLPDQLGPSPESDVGEQPVLSMLRLSPGVVGDIIKERRAS